MSVEGQMESGWEGKMSERMSAVTSLTLFIALAFLLCLSVMLGGFDAIIEPYGSEELSMDFGLNLNFFKKP